MSKSVLLTCIGDIQFIAPWSQFSICCPFVGSLLLEQRCLHDSIGVENPNIAVRQYTCLCCCWDIETSGCEKKPVDKKPRHPRSANCICLTGKIYSISMQTNGINVIFWGPEFEVEIHWYLLYHGTGMQLCDSVQIMTLYPYLTTIVNSTTHPNTYNRLLYIV